MKKFIIFIIITFITCSCFNTRIIENKISIEGKRIVDKKVKKYNLIKLYETDEGIRIYSKMDDVLYSVENKNISLKEELLNKKITIDEFINKLEIFKVANDGGSVFYVSNEKLSSNKFYVAKCNKLLSDGRLKDIFIDTDEERILRYCSREI